MRLVQVVLHLDRQELRAWVEDDQGRVQPPVSLRTDSKDPVLFPPADWYEQVVAETDFSNRALPGYY